MGPRALAAVAALLAVALSGCGERSVVVRDQDGEVLAKSALPADGSFALEYRHSYYGVAARERFSADGDGFRMIGVESPSEAVLDYYELAGTKRAGAWKALVPSAPQRFKRLPLIATPVGRRTLAVDGRRYPLFGGAPRHVTIEVEESRWP